MEKYIENQLLIRSYLILELESIINNDYNEEYITSTLDEINKIDSRIALLKILLS